MEKLRGIEAAEMSARAGKKPVSSATDVCVLVQLPSWLAQQKSKEMTWSEKELAKHMLKDKKRNSSVDGGYIYIYKFRWYYK